MKFFLSILICFIVVGVPALFLANLIKNKLVKKELQRVNVDRDKLNKVQKVKYDLLLSNKNEYNICFIGDSLFLSDELDNYLKENNIANWQIKGLTTRAINENFVLPILDKKFKKIIFAVGANDLMLNISYKKSAENIKAFIKAIKEKSSAEIFYIPILPVNRKNNKFFNKEPQNSILNEDIIDLNIEINKIEQLEIVALDKIIDEEKNFDLVYTFNGLNPNAHFFEKVYKPIIDNLILKEQ